MRLPARLILAAAAGAAVALAFPPYGWWPLLLVGLLCLIALLHGLAPGRGALVGLVFGVAYMGLLLPWMRVNGADSWVGLTILESLFFGAFGWAAARVRTHRWWPLATPALWAGVEMVRSHVPFTGFPWGKIAFALTDSPLAAYVRYLGVPALGALVVLLVAVLWWAILRLPGTGKRSLPAAATATIGVIAVLAAGAVLPVGLAGEQRPVRVAAVQGGIPGTGANGMGEQREVVANHARATQQYAADVRAGEATAADVVIWPENSTDIDPLTDAQTAATIASAADAVNVPMLVGALTAGSTPHTLRNVGIVWSPTTGPGDMYVKRNLVPFGEYIPMRDLIAPLISRLDQIPRDFEAGEQVGVLDLGPVVVGDAMCYDVAFEGVAAPAVRAGAELLVVQTNNATYVETGQPAQQWAISRMRALETGRDLVVASTNGISGIVAADGDVLSKSTDSDAVVLTATVHRADGLTSAVRFGTVLEWGLALLGLLALLATLLTGARGERPRASSTGSAAERTDSDRVDQGATGPPREPVGQP
ncbi:MAG: apolipoprotein N-acyltransferase [Nocardioidaceae bacterium]|nr:apolipoprotein N-acyltransferase [Nocardioidaceae bacterium]